MKVKDLEQETKKEMEEEKQEFVKENIRRFLINIKEAEEELSRHREMYAEYCKKEIDEVVSLQHRNEIMTNKEGAIMVANNNLTFG